MRKSKVGSNEFCGIEMRSIKKESTKVFVYFESDSTVEKILKTHSRTIDGRRVNIQQAIVENLKKPTKKTTNGVSTPRHEDYERPIPDNAQWINGTMYFDQE